MSHNSLVLYIIMSALRRRRWTNIKPTLVQRLVLAGEVYAAMQSQTRSICLLNK